MKKRSIPFFINEEDRMMMKSMVVAVMFMASGVLNAGTPTAWLKVTYLGCDKNTGVCTVGISGGVPVGPEGCRDTDLQWDEVNTPGGSSILALLTAAQMASRDVYFVVSDVCPNPYSPTFDSVMVK